MLIQSLRAHTVRYFLSWPLPSTKKKAGGWKKERTYRTAAPPAWQRFSHGIYYRRHAIPWGGAEWWMQMLVFGKFQLAEFWWMSGWVGRTSSLSHPCIDWCCRCLLLGSTDSNQITTWNDAYIDWFCLLVIVLCREIITFSVAIRYFTLSWSVLHPPYLPIIFWLLLFLIYKVQILSLSYCVYCVLYIPLRFRFMAFSLICNTRVSLSLRVW